MANRICHFEIPADDPEKLKEFYEKTFGWKIAPMPGTEGTEIGEYMMIDTGEETLGGGMMKRQSPEHTPANYSLVDDIDQHIRMVEENGGRIVVPKMPVPGIGWSANALDPQGNHFGLFQEDKEAK